MKRTFVINEVATSTCTINGLDPACEETLTTAKPLEEYGFKVGDLMEIDMGPWYPATRVQRIKRAFRRVFWRWL